MTHAVVDVLEVVDVEEADAHDRPRRFCAAKGLIEQREELPVVRQRRSADRCLPGASVARCVPELLLPVAADTRAWRVPRAKGAQPSS